MTTGRLPSIEGGIQPTIVDAKGDLIVATAADTVARLAVGGTNDQVLTVDSTTATGLKWATPATPSAGANWSLLNTGGTALTGAGTITVSGISGADKIMILVSAASNASGNRIYFRFNTDSGDNYFRSGQEMQVSGTYSSDWMTRANGLSGAGGGIELAILGSASAAASGYCLITGCNSSGVKVYNSAGAVDFVSGTNSSFTLGGYYAGTSVITSISLYSASNFDNGTIYVYTSA